MGMIPSISGDRIVRALLRDGWSIVGGAKHAKLRKWVAGQLVTLIVPRHPIVKKGTLAAILADSGISLERFKRLL